MTTAPRPPLALPDSVPLRAPEGFAARLAEVGAAIDDATLARMGDYLARLLAMNEQMNLTAIRSADDAWERHVLDALSLLPLLADVPAGAALVDVGSGGGLPGIPLAIARPDLAITLVEATQKKAAFLGAVSEALQLANVAVYADRAEELGRDELGETFDVVTARAVGRVKVLAPLLLPFARPGGLILLIKGQRAEEELLEAKATLAKLGAVHEKTVATPTGRVVVLRKRS